MSERKNNSLRSGNNNAGNGRNRNGTNRNGNNNMYRNGNQNRNSMNGDGSGGNNGRSSNRSIMTLLIMVALVFLVMYMLSSSMSADTTSVEITYNEFIQMVEDGRVESVEISDTTVSIILNEDDEANYIYTGTQNVAVEYYTGLAEDKGDLTEWLMEMGVAVNAVIPSEGTSWFVLLLSYGLPILLLVAFYVWMMRRSTGMMGGMGKSTAKVYVQQDTGVTFKDVAGQDEAQESLMEIVDFLHNPDRYTKIGAKLPKGALLVGPPGTGKTLLARAVAGEAHVPFFSLSGSDFVEMFVGMGASRVRDLFKQAQESAPCIIFIDEIDAIGKSRDSRYGGGNDEREQTLNQLLSEMDGFDSSKGVFILAATNRPEVLDKALLRPGRFDRRIIVEKPDLIGRINTLKVHSRDVRMDDTVDFEAIALATSGAVGSDLANMVNEAAINAVRNGRDYVTQADLFESVEVVLVGKEKKDRIMGEEERRIVSYHEVGHALISALQKNSEPVQKITIVPRTMGALGYVMNVPEEEKYMNTKAELHDMLVKYMGGRAAEELVFDTVTNGAADDIEKATQIARAMVTQYGMSEEFGLMSLESVESQYLDGRPVMNCADGTAALVDDVVKRMLAEAYDEAKNMISQNMDVLHKIAAYLIQKETITGKEFMEIYHQVLAERGTNQLDGENASAQIEQKAQSLVDSAASVSSADAAGQPSVTDDNAGHSENIHSEGPTGFVLVNQDARNAGESSDGSDSTNS